MTKRVLQQNAYSLLVFDVLTPSYQYAIHVCIRGSYHLPDSGRQVTKKAIQAFHLLLVKKPEAQFHLAMLAKMSHLMRSSKPYVFFVPPVLPHPQ
ncbi:MAG: hypothetical protein ETSY2_21845 [Candidatus Entotheonella gemina]|uniref:Uncharacterized protein n=1 Tax=Candidatus Entotheonella gemina TaxID=1429439 RepID=W4M6R5_9BACT|nr:MAG: hypothetical protein ETSY2_21845 [Candidatus Entotheonella gemina]